MVPAMRSLLAAAVLVLGSVARADAPPPLETPSELALPPEAGEAGDESWSLDLPSVSGASKYTQKISLAPSAVTIVTAEEIARLQREVADKTDRLGRLAKEMGELKAKGLGKIFR